MSWHSTDFNDDVTCLIPNADPQRLREALMRGELDMQDVGFTFSGGGFLLPYHLACIRALRQIGLLSPIAIMPMQEGENPSCDGMRQHVGGASAGALAAAVVSCGLDLDEVDREVDAMSQECRSRGTWGRLGGCLRKRLEDLLPHDAHTRSSGRLHVAVSKIKPWGALKSKRVTRFESRVDLIEALMASCHLPLLSNGSLTASFRGRRVADGGFTDVMPVMRDVKYVVKISCLLVEMVEKMPMQHRKTGLRHISISPCMYKDWPFTASETFKAAIGPGSREMTLELRRAGERDVKRWWGELTQERSVPKLIMIEIEPTREAPLCMTFTL